MHARFSFLLLFLVSLAALLSVVHAGIGYLPVKYDPTAPRRWALFLSYASCKLRQHAAVQKFVMLEANHYYPDLDAKLLGGEPRIKIYETRAERDNATIDGNVMSKESLLQLLRLGPDRAPDPPEPIAEFQVKEWSTYEIHTMLRKWHVHMNFPLDLRVWFAKLGIDPNDSNNNI